MTVHEVNPHLDRVRRIRKIAGQSLSQHMRRHGNALGGFAIVTWNECGEVQSAYYTATGPISESLMPVYVHDALNRHVAVRLTERARTNQITGDDEPA